MLENSFAFLSEPIPSNRAAYRAHASFVKFSGEKRRVALVETFFPKPRSTCLRKRWTPSQSDRNWPQFRGRNIRERARSNSMHGRATSNNGRNVRRRAAGRKISKVTRAYMESRDANEDSKRAETQTF